MDRLARKHYDGLLADFSKAARAGNVTRAMALMTSLRYQQLAPLMTATQLADFARLLAQAIANKREADALDSKVPIKRWNERKGSWDEARIAELKALDRKYGCDKAIARAMGISLKAAQGARRRFIRKKPVPAFSAQHQPPRGAVAHTIRRAA